MKIKRFALVLSVVAMVVAAPAFAHHSFAMFDTKKTITLDGTVKEFQWTNPHAWIQVTVKDAAGNDVEWSVEGGGPNGLSRLGWTRNSLKPGDKAQVLIHPLKDGTNGGQLINVTVNGVRVGRPFGDRGGVGADGSAPAPGN